MEVSDSQSGMVSERESLTTSIQPGQPGPPCPCLLDVRFKQATPGGGEAILSYEWLKCQEECNSTVQLELGQQDSKFVMAMWLEQSPQHSSQSLESTSRKVQQDS